MSDEGISKQIWVAFCIDVTSQQQATEILSEIPLRLVARAFASLLTPQKFDCAQDDRLIDYLHKIEKILCPIHKSNTHRKTMGVEMYYYVYKSPNISCCFFLLKVLRIRL